MKILTAEKFLNAKLKDDSTPYGGISFEGETLKDFLLGLNIPFDTSMYAVNLALMDCGILPLNYEILTVNTQDIKEIQTALLNLTELLKDNNAKLELQKIKKYIPNPYK